MKKIAYDVILDEIKKEYKVVDNEGFILETGDYEGDLTPEELCEQHGIRLGISTYLVSVLFL